uniref:Uncharacterized protein n=1 Tax=Zooxanthella nutricula TaxID=1333877 RepID=A0A6V0FTE4_9DINO|mmetsp:Transcript_67977/g.208296  ORF Transcript_67977/g.208296 Transcript_67977/m.208296 type:complete len:360 (+) Transcript_67977:61-1140(+)
MDRSSCRDAAMESKEMGHFEMSHLDPLVNPVGEDDPAAHEELATLPVDVYGYLTLRLAEVWARDHVPEKWAFLHLFMAFLLYALHLTLVIGIGVFLLVMSRVHMMKWSNELRDTSGDVAHAVAALRSAAEAGEASHTGVSDSLASLCQELNGVPRMYIFYILIFIWVMRLWPEIKSSRDYAYNIYRMETRKAPDQRIVSEDRKTVLRLPLSCKIALFVLCFVVKMCVCLVTLHVGVAFLMLQNSGFGIVAKVVAMQIVIGMDEQVMTALALRGATDELRQAKFRLLSHPIGTFAQKLHWYDGVGSIAISLSGCLIVYFYTNYWFKENMSLRAACQAYYHPAWDVAAIGSLTIGDVQPGF